VSGLGLFSDPGVGHIDWWGVLLIAAALAPILVGFGWRWHLRRHWTHHPLRLRFQGEMANALWGSGVVMGVAAAAHVAGWPVWGTPLFGIGALGLLAAVALARGVMQAAFREQLGNYEERFPSLARPDARLPRVKLPSDEIPLLAAMGGGIVLYGLFVWHPWNHVLHMGLVPVGGFAGFAVGSLIAARQGKVPPPLMPKPPPGRAHRRGGRH
jgi:hypothetical protein